MAVASGSTQGVATTTRPQKKKNNCFRTTPEHCDNSKVATKADPTTSPPSSEGSENEGQRAATRKLSSSSLLQITDPTTALLRNRTELTVANPDSLLLKPPRPAAPDSCLHWLQTPWTFWYSIENRPTRKSVTAVAPLPGPPAVCSSSDPAAPTTRSRLDSDASADNCLGTTDYALNLHEISQFSTVEDFYRAFVYIRLPSQVPRHFNISMFRAGLKPMWENFGDNGGMWMIRVNKRRVLRGPAWQSGKKRQPDATQLVKSVVSETAAPYTEPCAKRAASKGSRRNARRCQNAKLCSDAEVANAGCQATGRRNSARQRNTTRDVALVDAIWETLVLSCIGELFEIPEVVGVMLSSRKTDCLISLWNVNNASNPELRFYIGQKIRDLCFWNPYNSVMWYKTFRQAIVDCSSHRNAESYIFTAPTAP